MTRMKRLLELRPIRVGNGPFPERKYEASLLSDSYPGVVGVELAGDARDDDDVCDWESEESSMTWLD